MPVAVGMDVPLVELFAILLYHRNVGVPIALATTTDSVFGTPFWQTVLPEGCVAINGDEITVTVPVAEVALQPTLVG